MLSGGAVDAGTIFETSGAEAQCAEAVAAAEDAGADAEKVGADAEKAGTEAEKAEAEAERATKHARSRAEQARATAERARAGASEIQAAAARVCAAPTIAPLLWQAGYMPFNSDSSRQTETSRRDITMSDAFSIATGSCLLGTNGACVMTQKFPSEYDPNENCSITVTADGFVFTTSFTTESGYDWLTVDGTRYSGSTGPLNQAVSSGATVTWESDYDVQNQGWRLCYSAEAPTPAPTVPKLPALTALSTACSVHVSTSGTDSDTCGESTDSACKSIQKGIDRAGDYNTVCVHKGIFGCETGWAGSITQSMMLLGFDAEINCNGAGAAFQIGYGGAVDEVVISGFHISNAVGGTSNQGFAGGVDAINTKKIVILSSTFENCAGQEAGAISVHATSDSNSNNVRTFLDLTIGNCYGGVSNPREGGGAGSVSVSYYANSSGSCNNNVHTMSNLQISNSSGGTNTQYGGGAGSISISHFSGTGSNNNNVHTMAGLQISNSSGGTNTQYGGAAGSISISHCSYVGSNSNNTHTLSGLQIRNSSGGTNATRGGAAGSISISHYSVSVYSGSNNNNVHTLSNLQISNSSGGTNTQRGGAAGSVSICHYSCSGNNNNNVHTLSGLQIGNSSGGTNTRSGGAAGSISVSCYTHKGSCNNNVHTLSNTQILNSYGGTNTDKGGAGALAIAYKGKHANNNHHTIWNFTIRDCVGGDSTQGAGAIALLSLGPTSGLNVTIQDSVFAFNRALSDRPEQSPLTGVAGAVRIYAKSTDHDTSNRAQITNTRFRSNSLDASCTGSLCIAGALAVSIQASIDGCIFDSNSCPRCSGALYADRVLNLRDSQLTNNTASQVLLPASQLIPPICLLRCCLGLQIWLRSQQSTLRCISVAS